MSDTVSVIIPTFNRAWCVLDAIKSVFEQNYYLSSQRNSQNLHKQSDTNEFNSSINSRKSLVEIIVVDDGSTDNTYELLKPFTNIKPVEPYKRAITLLRQENRGVSAARNLGIRHSSGDFIAFLDSDDLWMPDKLSCQVDFFCKNPDAMICQTEEIWLRNGKRVNPKHKHKKLSGMIFEPSLNLCLVSPSAVMMRREFFDIKGFFDETLKACEDYDLWLRTALDMPIWLVDKPCIIKKGGHYDQLSSNHSLDKYRIRSILNLLTNSTQNRTLTATQREAAIRVLRYKCDIYSKGCIKRGKIEEACYYKNLVTFDFDSVKNIDNIRDEPI